MLMRASACWVGAGLTARGDQTMKVSRRNFALSMAGAAAPALLRGQQGPLRARIKVDTERVIGDIDPQIYGNFIEHLGRCIDGGIFEEKSPLSDASGFRQDVMDAVKEAERDATALAGRKFFVELPLDGWHRSARPAAAASGDGVGHGGINRFGTHEFLDYVEKVGTEPYICANFGTGTWSRRSSGWSTSTPKKIPR